MNKLLDIFINVMFVSAFIIYGYCLIKIIFLQLNNNSNYHYKSSKEWIWMRTATYIFFIAALFFIIKAFCLKW